MFAIKILNKMKKGVILAFVAIATSLAVYAGVPNKISKEIEKTECCDKTQCCPTEAADCK